MRFVLDADQFLHQLIVDMESSGRVDQERVITSVARVLQSLTRQLQRIVRLRLFKDRLASRLRDDPQLFARRGPVNISREEQRLALLIRRQPSGNLSGRSRLT